MSCNQNRSSKMSNKSAPPSAFKSKVEQSILKSTEPITINETKERSSFFANYDSKMFLQP